MRIRPTSIASIVALALVAITTVLMAVFIVYFHLTDRREQLASLRRNVEVTADQASAALSLSVWRIDTVQIDKIIESMMNDNDLYGVVLKRPDAPINARVRDGQWKVTATGREFPKDGLMGEERPVRAPDGDVIGTVTIYATPRFVEQRLMRNLLSLAAFVVLLDVAMVAILYTLLWVGVLRPLKSVERYALAVKSGRGEDDDDAGPFHGELESLRLSIHEMVGLLDVRYKALQKNEAMLSGILNSIPQSVFWKDRNGVYIGCNEVFARTSGRRVDEIVGKTDRELPWPRFEYHADHADDEVVIKSGKAKAHVVEPLHQPDGRRLWIDTTKVPLRDETGGIYGVLGVYDDITERKRTQELLLESEKLRTVAGLAAGVAHEVNNPIAGMVQNAEVILNRLTQEMAVNQEAARKRGTTFEAIRGYVEDRGIPEMLHSIRSAGERASRIIQNLLVYSRRGVGASTVNLREVVERTLELSASDPESGKHVEEMKLEVVHEYARDTPSVICSTSQIQQVILNLIRNAVQAMAENPADRRPRLTLRTLRQPGFGVIEVEDNGPGIAPDALPRLFEPFFTTKPSGVGTGLGLFVCYHIVSVTHGGQISVRSTPGGGTCFTVRLPITEAR